MLYKLNMLYLVDDILHAIGGDRLGDFFDEVVLEPFVKIPWFENPIRSYRLHEKDIKAMSAKGYKTFDGDKGRFVKEWPASSLFCIEDR